MLPKAPFNMTPYAITGFTPDKTRIIATTTKARPPDTNGM